MRVKVKISHKISLESLGVALGLSVKAKTEKL